MRLCFNINTWDPTQTELDFGLKCIPEEDVERCQKFRFKRDAKFALISSLLKIQVVHQHLQIPVKDIQFTKTKFGKPIFKSSLLESKKFDFNVSHHGDWIVICSEETDFVGIDITKFEIPPNDSIESFMNLLREQKQNTDPNKLEFFFRFWCLKESYSKALGLGLSIPFQQLEFHQIMTLDESSKSEIQETIFFSLVENGKHLEDWNFELFYLDPKHCVAICSHIIGNQKPNPEERSFNQISYNELIQGLIPQRESNPTWWPHFQNMI